MIDSKTLYALLFAHGAEMQKKEMIQILKITSTTLEQFVPELRILLGESPLELLETETTLSLRTRDLYASHIEQLQKHDTSRDIGTAALEVLAIVLYLDTASRAHIDYMRGVNSSGTLRLLVQRGLLERSRGQDDARSWVYIATPELYAHLGIVHESDLPEYETIHTALHQTI